MTYRYLVTNISLIEAASRQTVKIRLRLHYYEYQVKKAFVMSFKHITYWTMTRTLQPGTWSEPKPGAQAQNESAFSLNPNSY